MFLGLTRGLMALASDIERNQKTKGMGGFEASFFYVLFQ